MQTTLRSPVTFNGTGLHTGRAVRMTIHPASANYGIWFRRVDVTEHDSMIPALWDAVSDTQLCTRISNADGVGVSTIEHVMAALAGTGVQNALIDIDGPEVPLLDGSSAQFVTGILSKGLCASDAPIRAIEVLKPVSVQRGDAEAILEPDDGLTIRFEIEFADAVIGHQQKSLNMANGTFVHELCDSRTFCRKADIDAMRDRGLIVGGSVTSAVVVDGDRVVTPGGMRHRDEPVRHKMLDALGDLALAGAPILGRYTGHKAGHAMTNLLLRALFADPTAYRVIECTPEQAARLPGAGLSRQDVPQVAAA
ncbi:UDP-3-O-acyl-N-acetylglucosamine deacetylase [Alphaproteobacteria bacterium GH1-50]|uniref:UDP-3-O-acyl-N-acetylglucosamine deacetylase n=1 Tax=Kangsaoukella pontilimi TaxID=2691042 RepID=A0A7C9J2C5_9RHOB|nr:UDP-3-O-acyl-N-acetylglucosamine deacetylase [Kangsaoukella pontilimi]MXQ07501.1 UDP-3-O-acyl-N-acetylglucosamine deacetylase [Kangsaoukella pontilimi]